MRRLSRTVLRSQPHTTSRNWSPIANSELLFGNLDLLDYSGESDLVSAADSNEYVPERLKEKVFGKYLVMREKRI